MAGIYLHIPFCRQACHYCNFHFSTSTGLQNDFLIALLKEVQLQKDFLQGESVATVYFGGGTPSLLAPSALQAILSALHQHFSIEAGAEITLEANPDDISESSLKAWQQLGINRLSTGVQSFFEDDLHWMNRAHTAGQALHALPLITQYFPNSTIDLIYGSPGLTDEKWQQNVFRAVEAGINHLSCYALTVEPKTALEVMIRNKKSAPVNSADQARQFVLLMEWLNNAGYEHYEISNFAKPGHRSRHNSAYWKGARYLGLGPSAHSYDGQDRQWNIANNALYIQSLNNNTVPFEKEVLTGTQKLNEYVMTSIRTLEGTDLEYIRGRFGPESSLRIFQASTKFIQQGLLVGDQDRLKLTNEGKLLADAITVELFGEEVH